MKSQHKIDNSGRVSFPAKFRDALGSSFYIVKSSSEPCLQVLSQRGWQETIDSIDSISGITRGEATELKRAVDARSQEVEPDKMGRVVINLDLRKHAGIDDQTEVVISGLMDKDRGEIWNVARWEGKIAQSEAKSEIVTRLADLGI